MQINDYDLFFVTTPLDWCVNSWRWLPNGPCQVDLPWHSYKIDRAIVERALRNPAAGIRSILFDWLGAVGFDGEYGVLCHVVLLSYRHPPGVESTL